MNKQEVSAMRNMLAEFGWEHTLNQVVEEHGHDLEEIKKGFEKIQPHIEELQNKFEFGVIDLAEFASELSSRFGREVTEFECVHFMFMNNIFQY